MNIDEDFKNFSLCMANYLENLGFDKIYETPKPMLHFISVYRNDEGVYISFRYQIREGYLSVGFGRRIQTHKLKDGAEDYSLSATYESFAKHFKIKSDFLDDGYDANSSHYLEDMSSLLQETLPLVLSRYTVEDMIEVERKFYGRHRLDLM